jgi:hypothetical protein
MMHLYFYLNEIFMSGTLFEWILIFILIILTKGAQNHTNNQMFIQKYRYMLGFLLILFLYLLGINDFRFERPVALLIRLGRTHE